MHDDPSRDDAASLDGDIQNIVLEGSCAKPTPGSAYKNQGLALLGRTIPNASIITRSSHRRLALTETGFHAERYIGQ
jgi:hypothetical protein